MKKSICRLCGPPFPPAVKPVSIIDLRITPDSREKYVQYPSTRNFHIALQGWIKCHLHSDLAQLATASLQLIKLTFSNW